MVKKCVTMRTVVFFAGVTMLVDRGVEENRDRVWEALPVPIHSPQVRYIVMPDEYDYLPIKLYATHVLIGNVLYNGWARSSGNNITYTYPTNTTQLEVRDTSVILVREGLYELDDGQEPSFDYLYPTGTEPEPPDQAQQIFLNEDFEDGVESLNLIGYDRGYAELYEGHINLFVYDFEQQSVLHVPSILAGTESNPPVAVDYDKWVLVILLADSTLCIVDGGEVREGEHVDCREYRIADDIIGLRFVGERLYVLTRSSGMGRYMLRDDNLTLEEQFDYVLDCSEMNRVEESGTHHRIKAASD